jgi:protein SCO1/2
MMWWRSRLRPVAGGALLAALIVVPASANSGEQAATPRAVVAVDEHLGQLLPLDAQFAASDGVRRPLGSWLGRGRPTLLVLAYNRCPMLCNLVLRGVADGLRNVKLRPGEDFDVVTLSIDPGETPAEAGRARDTALSRTGYDAKPTSWPFLTGRQPEIARVADRLGFRYRWDAQTRQFAHPAVIFVLSPRGEVTQYLYGLRWTSAELTKALQSSQIGVVEKNAGSLQGLVACFRSSEAGGKYASLIGQSLRFGSALVLTGVLSLIVGLARRERRRS